MPTDESLRANSSSPCWASGAPASIDPPPACSVVVCTRDRPAHLDRCLASLRRLDYPRFDIIVVDNAPRDARTHQVADRWGAVYEVEPVPGLSRARNRGARLANTEIIAFLDDDAVAEPSWLCGLVREFRDPTVMTVTGRIEATDIATSAGQAGSGLTGAIAGGPERRRVGPLTPAWFEMANFGGLGDGGNMAFRRTAFDVWPGFDERLGRGMALDGGEEHHAFFSLIDRGYTVVYTPDAVVRHPYPATVEILRARHVRDLRSAAAYMTLLYVEHPPYRWQTVRYALEALGGARRPWRSGAVRTGGAGRLIPFWRTLVARASGPLLYLTVRLRGRSGRLQRLSEVTGMAGGAAGRTGDARSHPGMVP